MTLIQALVLGAVQGLTEFFPVSSSGHLVIFQALFGLREPALAFDIFLHAGTLVAVVIYFRRDIIRLCTSERKTLLFIVIASIPTFIIGFFCKDAIEGLFSSPRTVGIMMACTGVWLIAASVFGAYAARRGARTQGLANSLAVGLAQGIAVIPGISRSGATISTGILCGLDKEAAFRFAFLLSLPAVGGACVLKAHKIGAALIGKESILFLAGGITAMLAGLATIGVLRRIVIGDRLYMFGAYCIAVGCAVAVFFR